MLTTLISALVLVQGPAQAPAQPAQTAVSVVQKMLAHYAGSKSLTGKISMVQSANNVSVGVETTVSFDRANNRLYIEQLRKNSESKRFLTVSDGKLFGYDKPEGFVMKEDRFKELVTQNGKSQSVLELYAAARPGLPDTNAILDIAISRPIDMKGVMGQWVNMKVHSRVEIDGVSVTAIVGDYADYPLEQPTGAFEAYINDNGDFVRYITKQVLSLPTGRDASGRDIGFQTVNVQTIWNAKLTLDQPVEAALFKVP